MVHTVNNFRSRWNNYKSNCHKQAHDETWMKEHLFEHFYDNDHVDFLSNVSRTFIDKTDQPIFKMWKLLETYSENICTQWTLYSRICVTVPTQDLLFWSAIFALLYFWFSLKTPILCGYYSCHYYCSYSYCQQSQKTC